MRVFAKVILHQFAGHVDVGFSFVGRVAEHQAEGGDAGSEVEAVTAAILVEDVLRFEFYLQGDALSIERLLVAEVEGDEGRIEISCSDGLRKRPVGPSGGLRIEI